MNQRKATKIILEDSRVVGVIEVNTMNEHNTQHIHLIPVDAKGMVAGVDGRTWHCNSASILAHAKSYPTQFAGDYFHASLDAAKTGVKAPASGWIEPASIKLESNGIWADVQWTGEAAQAIRDKAYKYISPVFAVNPKTKQILRLKGFGLTHYPNLGDLTPVANSQKESNMDEIIEEIREALNLPTASNAAEIKTELDKLFSRVGTLAANSQATLNEQITLIESRLMASEEKAAQAIEANSQKNIGDFVPRTEFDRLRQELQALATAQSEKKVELAVNAALEHGVIAPASLAWATDYCKKDPEGFAQFAANSVKVIPLGTDQHASTVNGQALNAEEIAVCSQLGVSTEDFLKFKASEEH